MSRTDVPTEATIYSDTAATLLNDHTLILDANGTFVMEKNQKLTVYDTSGAGGAIGNLTIKTNHQGITVGDLSALGKIDIDAGDVNSTITLVNRPPQRERLSSGLLSANPDLGMDIVAGFNGPGAITMRGTVAVIGGNMNRRIQFSAKDASTDIKAVPGVLNYLPGSNLAIVPVNIPDTSLDYRAKDGIRCGATRSDRRRHKRAEPEFDPGKRGAARRADSAAGSQPDHLRLP